MIVIEIGRPGDTVVQEFSDRWVITCDEEAIRFLSQAPEGGEVTTEAP